MSRDTSPIYFLLASSSEPISSSISRQHRHVRDRNIITFPCQFHLRCRSIASPASLHSCAVKSVTYATASTLSMTGKNVLPYATLLVNVPEKIEDLVYESACNRDKKYQTTVASNYVDRQLPVHRLFIRAASSHAGQLPAQLILMISIPVTFRTPGTSSQHRKIRLSSVSPAPGRRSTPASVVSIACSSRPALTSTWLSTATRDADRRDLEYNIYLHLNSLLLFRS